MISGGKFWGLVKSPSYLTSNFWSTFSTHPVSICFFGLRPSLEKQAENTTGQHLSSGLWESGHSRPGRGEGQRPAWLRGAPRRWGGLASVLQQQNWVQTRAALAPRFVTCRSTGSRERSRLSSDSSGKWPRVSRAEQGPAASPSSAGRLSLTL